jgi:hypothetical protein
MAKMRAVIIHGNGAVTLADGKLKHDGSSDGTPYDLDAALQNGAYIPDAAVPIGLHQGTAILVFVHEL